MRRAEVAALLALWLAAGAALQALTTRVADWFVMTDELLYERLAISVARHHSPLPRVHDVLIPNVDQLYPLLLSPVFGAGPVAQSVQHARFFSGPYQRRVIAKAGHYLPAEVPREFAGALLELLAE